MDINKLTQKSQEALQAAQNLAISYGHQSIGTEHMALALLEQDQGLIPVILEKRNGSFSSEGAAYGAHPEKTPRQRRRIRQGPRVSDAGSFSGFDQR